MSLTPTIADQFTGASAATTGAQTLSATPTAGRVLVSCIAGNTGGTTNHAITDAGGGTWNLLADQTNADMTFRTAWKFAVGNETTVTWSWTTNTAWRMVVMEYNAGVDTLTNTSGNNTTSVVTSQQPGSVTPNGSADFAVACGASDSASTWDDAATIFATWDGSFSEDIKASPTVQTARPLIVVGNMDSVSSAQNPTFATTGGTGDECCTNLLMWYASAAGVSIPIAAYHLNHHLGSMQS